MRRTSRPAWRAQVQKICMPTEKKKQITTRTKWKLMRKLQSRWNHFLVTKFSVSFSSCLSYLSTRRWESLTDSHPLQYQRFKCSLLRMICCFYKLFMPVWCFYVPSEWLTARSHLFWSNFSSSSICHEATSYFSLDVAHIHTKRGPTAVIRMAEARRNEIFMSRRWDDEKKRERERGWRKLGYHFHIWVFCYLFAAFALKLNFMNW